MSKRKKVKKSGARSASVANRVAKSQKSTFVKRPSIAKSVDEERKEGVGVIKNLVIGGIVLVVGATFLANYTGANKLDRGDLPQDAVCTESNECASGHVCYGYQNNPFTCKERCKDDDDCTETHSCKSVVRFGKKKVKPMKVCIPNDEL